ncbi:MAG: VWA domain-containing protein [Treponema sp.]|nr:VWA domain-containing protein [Treponema sp.]
MKKGLTEIVFVMDKSGSMGGLESDTIGGYNAFLRKQKKVEGEAFISTVLFSDESKVIHDRVPIGKVNDMTEEQYSVGGSTALLDAVGDAVCHIANIHKYARDEDRPEKTIFVITTDGMENSSKRRTHGDVKKLVESQKEKGWEFVFLGANIDAAEEASKIGISADMAATYECDEKGTEINFNCLERLACAIRAGNSAARQSIQGGAWKADIQKYMAKKH